MNSFTVSVKEHGRLNLPKGLRAALHLREQDDLIFRVRPDGVAEVVSATTIAQRSSGLFAHLRQEDSETDAFLAERRAESDQ